MPLFNETFKALQKEAQFTNEMLGAGATQIRRANYASKGVYFQAFTSLSTGLERIGKLCLMLDYYLSHNGKFPDFNYMKNEVGHKIRLIYEKSQEAVQTRSIVLQYTKNLSNPVHLAILEVLSDFAEGDRYSNIDLVLGGRRKSDPVRNWFDMVDSPLFSTCVSARKKQMIDHNAAIGAALMDRFVSVSVLHTSETGAEITEFEEASRSTGRYEAVAPYRQLYVLQVIRYW